jgi:hypothetical protein
MQLRRRVAPASRPGHTREPDGGHASLRDGNHAKAGSWGLYAYERIAAGGGGVDHGNLYGDGAAKSILGDWWGSSGPDADTWRFDLKAAAGDPVGRAFPVLVPDDAGRDALLRRFAADAAAGWPTAICARGRLRAFAAPTQASDLTGLSLELPSPGAVRLRRPPPGLR